MEGPKDHYVQLVCESVAGYLTKRHGLNKKEQQLLAYLLDDSNSMNIGDVCRSLKTTTMTLLTKTRPGLFRKVGKPGSELWNENIRQALESGDTPQFVVSRRVVFYSGRR